MNITYTQNGDYLIPNIIIRKTKPLGHYGRLRKAYLEMHRPILFNELVLSDKLFEHCAEIDETARNRMELIVRPAPRKSGFRPLLNTCAAQHKTTTCTYSSAGAYNWSRAPSQTSSAG